MTNTSGLTRRHLLASTAAAVAGLDSAMSIASNATQSVLGTFDEKKQPWIDAHSHIWTTDLARYPLRNHQTVEVLAPRSFTDQELMAIAEPEGVGRVVLIQHHPHHGFDNSYLVDTWRKYPDRFRIVGQIDDNISGVDKLMKSMLKTGVTGFRIGPRQDQPSWHTSDGMQLMWKTAAETRQSMCCLIGPDNLSELEALCVKYPDTPVVVDHFARIGTSGKVVESDLNTLCKLSAHKTVKVKISAYYALGRKSPPHHDLVPMIKRLFEAYGADRLMWASDSPYQIVEPNNYAASISLIRDHVDFVTTDERLSLLQKTAASTFFFV